MEVFSAITENGLTSCLKFFAFAARQLAAGDVSWVQYCMKTQERKLKETIATALAISSAEGTIQRKAMSHLDVLRGAVGAACVCEGKAIPGWEHILKVNSIPIPAYVASVLALFREGGGKRLNHFYVGAPNSGKTALTRPLLALFGRYAFVKPQVGTTFAMQGLIGAQVVVWNDFRWPHPPLS